MCDQIFLCLNKWQIFLCCYDWNACAELLLQCCMRWIQTRSVICVSNPNPTTADSRAVCLYPCKNYRLWTILNLTTTNLIVTTSLVQSCSCCHKNNQSGWNQSVPALLVCHCWRLQCVPTWSPVIMVTLTRTSTAMWKPNFNIAYHSKNIIIYVFYKWELKNRKEEYISYYFVLCRIRIIDGHAPCAQQHWSCIL